MTGKNNKIGQNPKAQTRKGTNDYNNEDNFYTLETPKVRLDVGDDDLQSAKQHRKMNEGRFSEDNYDDYDNQDSYLVNLENEKKDERK